MLLTILAPEWLLTCQQEAALAADNPARRGSDLALGATAVEVEVVPLPVGVKALTNTGEVKGRVQGWLKSKLTTLFFRVAKAGSFKISVFKETLVVDVAAGKFPVRPACVSKKAKKDGRKINKAKPTKTKTPNSKYKNNL